jgi:flavin-dependent dehydrogenase
VVAAAATAELTADVAVVGAGPAGAVAALMLAPRYRTLLLDRADLNTDPNIAPSSAARVGEALPAAARRLFRDMGLWQDFLQQGHAPCYGARSLWGGADPVSADSLRDPDGPGWHLDRMRFDHWLRGWAGRRGVALVTPAKLAGVMPIAEGWHLMLVRHGRPLRVATRFVVDAGGRAAPVARALGHRRRQNDRLVCRWLHGTAAVAAATTVVVAEPEGWWYTAPLPNGRRILAFHTDADLDAASRTTTVTPLLERAREQAELAALLAATRFTTAAAVGRCAAHTSWIDAVAGPAWLAVGDAALCCDPLSSQGLLNALYSGLMAAAAVSNAMAGNDGAIAHYQRTIAAVADAYRAHLAAWYALETRWPHQPFWVRRIGGAGGRPGFAAAGMTPPAMST